ncbi:EAL domain-containing protein [Sphingomonas sp.]|uniref:putative bifunctional diguanylate cyclase/phosphodiesterase n=1 Tax=Sphingomonas sp. TaxID=28214 RepID=UPI0025F0706F|nr:EAL domain-containing protein [Sphingomonas sp.]
MTKAIAYTANSKSRTINARNDVLTGGFVVAALIMFVGTGSQVVSSILDAISGVGGGVDRMLSIALILNIALIMFGWRRYRDLSDEISERATAELRATTLALRDPLTGFYNRRALAEQGAELLAKTLRRQKSLAMLMLDLDHFKNVNDVHGHAIGDALLKCVAAEVAKLMPPSAIAARLGGDEFACMFAYDGGNPEIVEHVAQAIVSRLALPFDADGAHVHISVSLGISFSDSGCETIDAMTRRADIAMYAAKHQGRNRYAWFDVSMEREMQARNDAEMGLRIGIPKGEFVPYFEQQIDLTTGRLHGFEMLARWDHPTKGLILPDQFICVAEDTGMIADLSMSVMRQALVEARNWDPSISISVNISPTQLKDPWLAQKLVKLLTETGFPPTRLEVEITETSLFENLALAQSIVGSLKNQGIKLALDDFGTGYSSLAHLRALPFDRIKIDKSFITSIIDNPESAAIVNAITRLGDSLGLPVTAEGIEDAAIEERLRQLGCHKGQGWLYGRPLPIPQARALLAERNLLPSARASLAEPKMAGETIVQPVRRVG